MHPQDIESPPTVRLPIYRRDGTVAAYTVLDTVDLPLVAGQRWSLHVRGYAFRRAQLNGKRVAIFLHRVLLGLPHGVRTQEGDHINRDTLDNRRANLRVVPHAGNMQNRPSHHGATSRYRGVHWHQRDRIWIARVTVHGRQINLGRFHDEAEAGEVARAARERWMPYAVD